MLKRILQALSAARAAPREDPAQQRARARMHFEAGEFDAAAALFGTAAAAQPGDASAHLELALALERAAQPAAAARAAADALALAPGDGPTLRHAARLFDHLRAAGPDDDARADPAVAAMARANALLARGAWTDARAALEAALAARPGLPFALQRLACLAALDGDHERADALFRQSGGQGLPPDEYIRLSRAWLAQLDGDAAALEAQSGARPEGAPDAPPADADAVFLVCCDPAYFRRFAHALVASLREHAGVRLALHLHLVNPDPWLAEEVAALTPGGWIRAVQVTTETRALDSPDAAKTYYACARLFRLPQVLARARVPVIAADIDLLALRGIAPLVDLARRDDVALLRWQPPGWRLWDGTSASVAVFAPGPGALRFARLAARYAERFIDRPGGAWYLDQIALVAARALLEGNGARVGAIPPDWLALYDRDGEAAAPAAMFWSVTANLPANAAATRGALFGRHLPRTRRAFGWTLPGSDAFFPEVLARAPTAEGRRRWDFDLMRLCIARARARRRALDIGGHVGFWSDWLARAFERVDAFEPAALMRDCFRANVAHANVTLHDCGLGEAPTRVAMAVAADNTGMSHVAPGAAGDTAIRTLDSFGFDDVDFVKIDTEGYEARVLRGAEQTLRRCRPLVLVEQVDSLAGRYGEPPEAAAALLARFGARRAAELADNNLLFDWPD